MMKLENAVNIKFAIEVMELKIACLCQDVKNRQAMNQPKIAESSLRMAKACRHGYDILKGNKRRKLCILQK